MKIKTVLFCSVRLEPLLAFDATGAALRNVYYSSQPRIDFAVWPKPEDLFLPIPCDAVLDRSPFTIRTVSIELKKLMDVSKFGTREWFFALMRNHSEEPLSNLELASLKIDLNKYFR